jgi:hypothetical protein
MSQRLGKAILFTLAVSSVVAVAQIRQNASLKNYSDLQYGVSFQYPSTWNSDPSRGFYIQAQILIPDHPPLANVGFGGSQKSDYTPYPGTNLLGVQFVYVVSLTPTAKQCQDATQSGEGSATTTQESINGVPYQHISSSNAGMCHQANEQIYSTYRAGRCYLFDAVIETACGGGTIEGARDITPAELTSISKQLTQIMHSVKIAEPGK